MPSNHLIFCCPLLLPSNFPSIRVFSNESAVHIRWSKYWSFSFNISPSKEYSGFISFRIQWFDLLAVQGTLESYPKKRVFSSTIVQKHQFFGTQPSLWSNSHTHDYLKKHSSDYTDLFSKVISLLFNMLSRLAITFLPRCKCLLIACFCLQSSAVILESKKIKSVTVSIVSPSISHEVMGSDAMILVF